MKLTCVIENTAGRALTWAEHGLCVWIEDEGVQLMWDSGESPALLQHNLEALDLDLEALDAAALSHGHVDHSGGLPWVLEQRPGLTVHAHSDILVPRYSERKGELEAIGVPEALRSDDVNWALSSEPVALSAHVRTTGGITERPYPQGGSDHLFCRRDGQIVLDDYADDLSLVLTVPGGIVLLCGCCHAGLRNTLATLRRQSDAPLLAVIGGTHLGAATRSEIDAIGDLLQQEGSPKLYLNHCTGATAQHILWGTFGERLEPFSTGMRIAFD